jgi:hypothetical protein
MKNNLAKAVFLFLFCISFGRVAIAQIPKLISYQGFLTDNDQPVADDTYDITVKIFDAVSAGNELWSEDLQVNTINGLFSTVLGANTPLDLLFDQAYFVSTAFEGTELLPRIAMTGSPYAFNSITAGNPFALDNADGSAQEVVYVDAFSNVGIGTTSPFTKLHILSPNGQKNELFIEPGNWDFGGDQAQITLGDFNHRITSTFGEGTTFYDVDQFRFEGSSATFENDATVQEQLGIGGPPLWRLHAIGDVADFIVYGDFPELDGETIIAGFRSKTASGGQVRFESDQIPDFVDMGTDGDGNFVIEQNDVDAFIITTGGSVGIGRTFALEPASKLTIGNQDIALKFYPGRRGFSDDVNAFHLDMDGTKDLTLTDNLIVGNKMVIGSLATPGDEALYVDGNIRLEDDNSISGVDGLIGFNDLRLFGDPPQGDELEDIYIAQDGSVLIGRLPETTLLSKFHVNGTEGRAALLQDSELKLLGPGTAHFAIFNDQAGSLRIQDASSLAQPGTPGFDLMSISNFGNVTVTGAFSALSVTETSDRRYKKNFTAIDQALDKVLQLDGLYYQWRVEEFPAKKFTTEQQMGFIAQDVEKLFPEMVHTDQAGYKSVNYGKLTPVLVEAIKEQQNQIDQLKAEKAVFKAELEALKSSVMARLEALENQSTNQVSSKAAVTTEKK